MVDQTKIQWIDLSRFGAALRIIPANNARPQAVACLDIHDQPVFIKQFSAQYPEVENVKERWLETLSDLGFNSDFIWARDADYNVDPWLRYFGSRGEFKLGELKRLCPELNKSDYKALNRQDVFIEPILEAENVAAWTEFAKDVLAYDAVDVYTPVVSEFDQEPSKSKLLFEHRENDYRKGLSEQNAKRRFIAMTNTISSSLSEAGYRQSALIEYYPDLASAKKDGYAEEQLKRVDLPFSLPLHATDNRKIIALRDFRQMPELMVYPPSDYYSGNFQTATPGKFAPDGLMVNYLRGLTWLEATARQTIQEIVRLHEVVPVDVDQLTKTALGFARECDAVLHKSSYFSSSSPVRDLNSLRVDGDAYWSELRKVQDNEFRLVPIPSWNEVHISSFARLVTFTTGDDPLSVATPLKTMIEHVNEQIKVSARETAKSELHSLAAHIKDETPDSPDSKLKHVDSGEKIGGARKDFARRALTLDDLESMNSVERELLVVKSNIWPALDYPAMKDAGVKPYVAFVIKKIKDTLATGPYREDRRYYGSDDNETQVSDETKYIHAIELVRDNLATVKTMPDLYEAMKKIHEVGAEGNSNSVYGSTQTQVQWGHKASEIIHHMGQYGYLPVKIRESVESKIGRDPGTDYWGYLIKEKKQKSEQEKEENAEKAETNRLLHRPHLEHVQRSGNDWRGGKDITADQLREHFGFRAVEFGNWLPQDERGAVLNYAFDSFCDLAEALDLPPKALSFGNTLAIAFGSRGSGGKSAALAHFEPSRFVINLTRLKGAGSLAHEWIHAYDWHEGQKKGYTTEQNEGKPNAVGRLVAAMKLRDNTPDELWERSERNIASCKSNVVGWLYEQPKEVKERLGSRMQELYERAYIVFAEKARERLQTIKDHPQFLDSGYYADGVVPSDTRVIEREFILESLRRECTHEKLFKGAKKPVEGNLNYLVNNLSVLVTIDVSRELNLPFPASFVGGVNRKETDFLRDAKGFDQTRTNPYWATTIELFARAGACYVHDRLTAKEIRNDYLVYGAEDGRSVTGLEGSVNTSGADRERINHQFDAIIDEYRLRYFKEISANASPDVS